MKSYAFVALSLAALIGCSDKAPPPHGKAVRAVKDEVQAERAKLGPDDRALADAQELCPVSGERLGSMGPPVKVWVKGHPVLLCCASCENKALADPDTTLAKVDEQKARKTGTGPAK